MDVLRFSSVDAMHRATVATEWHPLVRVAAIEHDTPPYIVVLPSHPIEYVTVMPALLRYEFERGPLAREQTLREFEEAFMSCTGGELVRQQASSIQNTYRGILAVREYVPESSDTFHESETVITKVQTRDVTMRRVA